MLYNSPQGLIDSVKDILEGKKKLHPNQQKIDVHEPEKDEITADDFKKLRAMKKEEKCGCDCGQDPCVECGQSHHNMGEEKDTPGNSYAHQCAVHVKHEQFGEGKTLFSQHAEPDEEGNIAWYDVMFEHGIEKEIKIEDLEILVSESHMNHKKKMKEETELDEARGRPRKNPTVGGDDGGTEPDHNIVMHLKKSIDTKGNHDVKFDDKSSHKVPAQVAHKVLTAMGKLKPADRLEVQKHVQQSHKNLMDVHGMIK